MLIATSLVVAQDATPTAMIWLRTDCPLSQNYTRTLSQLQQKYGDKSVHWKAVFVNEKAKNVKRFLKKYRLNIPYVLDQNKVLTLRYNATITPEAILVQNNKILYQGAIDNQAVALGKFSQYATQHYLQAAIDSTLAGKAIDIVKTQAIGCIIE